MKFKSIMSGALAAAMVLVSMPQIAAAKTYGDFEYSVQDGSVTISRYNGSDEKVEIPAEIEGMKVTEIGYMAFERAGDVVEITIPDSVVTIGENAFSYLESLAKVKMPASLTSLGDYVFYHCEALTEIEIPDGVTEIGDWVFANCSSLAEIEIPDNVTRIGEYAFLYCTSLKEIEIPDNVTQIGDGAFGYCKSLTEINIPDGVTTINYRAFQGCSALTEIVIPDGVTEIGSCAFEGCSALAEINIPDSVTKIGSSAFAWTALTKIEIPAGVTEVGDTAFQGCEALTAINVSKDNKYFASDDGVLFDKDFTELICYPIKKENTAYDIPDSVTKIDKYAFYSCAALTEIVIPDGVTEIGVSAFSGCTALTEIAIPDGVTKIEANTFYKCSSLVKAVIPESVTEIGVAAFAECSSLSEIEIPDGVTSIGGWAFDRCSSLVEIEIPDGVTEIGTVTFQSCSALTKIVIPESVTVIGDSAFIGCTSLTDIIIPDGVTEIGDAAFAGCLSLAEIEIPDSVTALGRMTFMNCDSLTKAVIPNSVTEIESDAFLQCYELTIYGYTGSCAETFANENEIPFIAMDYVVEDEETGIKVFFGVDVAPETAELSVALTDFSNSSRTYIIRLIDDKKEVQPEGTVIVRIPVPEQWDTDTIAVYRNEKDDTLTDMNATVSRGYISFTTDSLGKYTVVNEKEPEVIEDEDTGIQVTDDEGVLPADAELKVELDEAGSTEDKVVYNITITVDGQPINIDGTVTVTIPIPEELKGLEEYYVFYRDKDGKLTDMQAAYDKDKNCVTFTTDHFSEYILAVKNLTATIRGDVNNSGGDPNNDDLIMLAQYLAKWQVDINMEAANVNGDKDGVVNNDDLIMLAQLLAGWKV